MFQQTCSAGESREGVYFFLVRAPYRIKPLVDHIQVGSPKSRLLQAKLGAWDSGNADRPRIGAGEESRLCSEGLPIQKQLSRH